MSSNDPDNCCLPEMKACCCTCRYLLRDYHHCTTPEGSALRDSDPANKCVCSVPRGWICAGFILSGEDPTAGVHSGWGEHGLCEMHRAK